MSMGNRIARRRKELKLTLAELSRLCGISSGAIGDLEHGRQASSTRLHHLADALRVRLAWLESGEGPIEADAAPLTASRGSTLSAEAEHVATQWGRLAEPARTQTRVMIENFLQIQLREDRRRVTPPPLAKKLPLGNS
jgi:transcriptional regulator with XRE-family HTH domain